MIDGPPPNHSPELLIDDVSKKVEVKFKSLEEVAEGDAQPERETATQGVEQTPVLGRYIEKTIISQATLPRSRS